MIPGITFHRDRWKYLLVALLIVVVDQITKQLISHYLPIGRQIRLFDGELVWIQHVLNPGMAFGLRMIPTAILAIISAFAACALIAYLFVSPYSRGGQGLALGLIIGGAIGNLIDRVAIGKVVDFISVDFPDFIMTRWPTFNVADSSVCVGMTLLIILSFLQDFSTPNESEKADSINVEE